MWPLGGAVSSSKSVTRLILQIFLMKPFEMLPLLQWLEERSNRSTWFGCRSCNVCTGSWGGVQCGGSNERSPGHRRNGSQKRRWPSVWAPPRSGFFLRVVLTRIRQRNTTTCESPAVPPFGRMVEWQCQGPKPGGCVCFLQEDQLWPLRSDWSLWSAAPDSTQHIVISLLSSCYTTGLWTWNGLQKHICTSKSPSDGQQPPCFSAANGSLTPLEKIHSYHLLLSWPALLATWWPGPGFPFESNSRVF